ncbi:hypothetical protein FA95DRAFT_1561560 [Auriscalpium vulgare]|uniref:Uncharacterized protein n=1 Tax=Auriscalpium vulgare TaxID=40419 RepID=A0ACB8RM95_9AGAM|nr:hypothetical protein FA95DRAFT_1561560 [Auriscalpium vulgare]
MSWCCTCRDRTPHSSCSVSAGQPQCTRHVDIRMVMPADQTPAVGCCPSAQTMQTVVSRNLSTNAPFSPLLRTGPLAPRDPCISCRHLSGILNECSCQPLMTRALPRRPPTWHLKRRTTDDTVFPAYNAVGALQPPRNTRSSCFTTARSAP